MNFLMMGNYGVYVWSAYAITLSIFGLNLFFSLREKSEVKKTLKHYFKKMRSENES